MRSIDKLREYVKDAPASSMGEMARAIVTGMADEIERDERSLRGFAERLEAAAAERADVTLFGVDYTALPVDADGVPIHVGDVMDEGKVAKVVLTDEHWEPSVYVYKLPNVQHEYFCNEVGHHHAPTVEDVLEELLREYDRDDSELTNGEIVERFAARLRLAGDV